MLALASPLRHRESTARLIRLGYSKTGTPPKSSNTARSWPIVSMFSRASGLIVVRSRRRDVVLFHGYDVEFRTNLTNKFRLSDDNLTNRNFCRNMELSGGCIFAALCPNLHSMRGVFSAIKAGSAFGSPMLSEGRPSRDSAHGRNSSRREATAVPGPGIERMVPCRATRGISREPRTGRSGIRRELRIPVRSRTVFGASDNVPGTH